MKYLAQIIFSTPARGMCIVVAMLLVPSVTIASGTLSISALTPGTTVYVGGAVTFSATPVGFTNPTFTIDDNFGGTSISSANINSSGAFTWTPSTGDIGTHAIVITAVDSSSVANVTLYITVSAATLTLSTPAPSTTIEAGIKVTFTSTAVGFTSPTYVVSDSFSSGTVTSTNIDTSGTFTWTPQLKDVGNHTIGVTVSDSLGRSKTASVVLTVPVPTALSITISSLPVGGIVSPNQIITFTAVASGAATSTYSVSDAFFPSTITAGSMNASGVFTWTPTTDEFGEHRLTVYVTDAIGRTASKPVALTVQSAIASIQSLSPGAMVYVGRPVSFSMITTGFVSSTFVLGDSFSSTTISSANIDSSGRFTWTPKSSDVGNHTITVTTSDTSGKTASSSQFITVTSNPTIFLQTISPGNIINSGSILSFSATTSGMSTSTFALTDTFSGSSLVHANINTEGKFAWVPKVSDVGIHHISVYATESTGRSVSTSTTVTVLLPGQITNIPSAQTLSYVTSSHVFTQPLSVGVSGTEVLALQKLLIQMGHLTAVPNGYFGYQTEAAVKKFQLAKGIPPAGFVGPLTRSLLNQTTSLSGVPTTSTSTTSNGYKFLLPLSVGSRGNGVTELQKILTLKGFYTGTVTGYFGPLTEAGVKKFQSAKNLEPLGNVGPATRAQLNSNI